MTHKGIPDYQRAARYILKDFVAVCMDYDFIVLFLLFAISRSSNF